MRGPTGILAEFERDEVIQAIAPLRDRGPRARLQPLLQEIVEALQWQAGLEAVRR